MMSSPSDLTTSFTGTEHAYKQHRPGYPAQVFDLLFAGLGDVAQLIVADIGAGTGISSRDLAQRVARVYAVEPNAAMRAQAEAARNIDWSGGTGEQTGLRDKSVDAALAFQAFHWFDIRQAYREFVRIARRRIGLVQYERDENEEFARMYGNIVRRYATDDTETLRRATLERFAALAGNALHRTAVPSAQRLTRQGLIGRAFSASYLPRTGAAADELRGDLQSLFRRYERQGYVELVLSMHVMYADIT